MRRSIRPFLFRIHRPYHQFVFVRIDPRDIPGILGRIKQTFERFAPEYPYEYQFLDEAYEDLYSTERQLGLLFRIFCSFAIFISCLGLFGLTSYTAEVKTKEIGVRKVLGASVSSIILLLSKQFTRWILLANIVAWPIAWFTMSRWLKNFAYRIDIEWWVFLLAGGLALMIALLTVGTQAVRAALANPVESLRYE